MRTLIYKRTHPGDPDAPGRFGINDCMGRVRKWEFEAVIGVGGIGAEPRKHELARKVNWIGIGPRKGVARKRGPVITFEHFLLFGCNGSDGPSFEELAQQLAARMYSKNVRFLVHGLSSGEKGELRILLDLARDAPASSARGAGRVTSSERCVRRIPSAKSLKGCSS